MFQVVCPCPFLALLVSPASVFLFLLLLFVFSFPLGFYSGALCGRVSGLVCVRGVGVVG